MSAFQVDLRGMVDLLSRNLYSGPRVYVRELLQNAVDAIAARRAIEPDCPQRVTIELGRADGAATLTGGNPSAWPSAASPMGALEILGGTAACAAALFMISRSSLGAFVVGALSTVIGLPFILMPGVTKSILGPTVNRLQAHSDLGKALSTYVMDDGLSGRFILMGVLTIMVAVVGHVARRSGQRTQDDGRGPRD